MRRWEAFLAAPLLMLVVALLGSYAWARVECDTKAATCLVTEHRLAFTRAREVGGVTGAQWAPNGAVYLVTDHGIEPTVRLSPVVPAYNVASEFVSQLTSDSAAECAARLRSMRCELSTSNRSLCHVAPPHVDASLVPDPATVAWMSFAGTGFSIVGLFMLVRGLLAFRGVPLLLHLGRRALAIPRLDHGCHARELPIDGIIDVIIRSEHVRHASSHLAMFVVLATGESVRVTPIGKAAASTLEPSRRALAEALDLDPSAAKQTCAVAPSRSPRAVVVRALLGVMLLGLVGLVALPTTIWGRGEDLALGGYALLGSIAFVGSVIGALLLAPLVLSTIQIWNAGASESGTDIHAAIAKRPRLMRILIAIPLLPAALTAALCVSERFNAVGARLVSPVSCVSDQVHRTGPSEWNARLTCAPPSGPRISGSGHFANPPPAEFTTQARRGALGVWLVRKSEME